MNQFLNLSVLQVVRRVPWIGAASMDAMPVWMQVWMGAASMDWCCTCWLVLQVWMGLQIWMGAASTLDQCFAKSITSSNPRIYRVPFSVERRFLVGFWPIPGSLESDFSGLLSFRENETVRDKGCCFGWAKYQGRNFCAANPSYHLGYGATLTGGLQV